MTAARGARIVVAGHGGQGVLFATRLLGEAALAEGIPVRSSETHGMAQRGGSVVASLKLGGYASALVLPGTADLLLALAQGEAYRNLGSLRAGGACLAAAPDDAGWDPEVAEAARAAGICLETVDAAGIALDLKAPVLLNVALLGALTGLPTSPLPAAAVRGALERRSPEARLEANLAAFSAGRMAVGGR